MLSRPDLRGDYQLVVGKRAMLTRGCPKCGYASHFRKGLIVEVISIENTDTVQCRICNSQYLVTMMVAKLLDGRNVYTATYLWKPMPDLDDKYELEAAADNLRREKLVTHKDILTGRRMKGSTR